VVTVRYKHSPEGVGRPDQSRRLGGKAATAVAWAEALGAPTRSVGGCRNRPDARSLGLDGTGHEHGIVIALELRSSCGEAACPDPRPPAGPLPISPQTAGRRRRKRLFLNPSLVSRGGLRRPWMKSGRAAEGRCFPRRSVGRLGCLTSGRGPLVQEPLSTGPDAAAARPAGPGRLRARTVRGCRIGALPDLRQAWLMATEATQDLKFLPPPLGQRGGHTRAARLNHGALSFRLRQAA
jgi:hypothetical protein